MENLLQEIPNVCIFLDHLLISVATEVEHLNNLQEVLTHLEKAGMQNMFAFLLPQVEYLGHQIPQSGLHPTKEKVWAIVEAPAPQNVLQLKSLCYNLLHKKMSWQWKTAQETAFNEAKSKVLVHYDPHKPRVLSYNASQYGVGAIFVSQTR